MKNKIGIMSGRLSSSLNNKIQEFPATSWKNEFQKARNIGFEVIEWVFDLNKNPIMTDEGIKEILSNSTQTDVEIHAVCADYFMEKKLFAVSQSQLQQNIDTLKKLIKQCHKSNITILELPFVDVSSLKNDIDKKQILQNLESVLSVAQDNNVNIALETDLPPDVFKDLLLKFNHPNIMVNYDVGNSTANCFEIDAELRLLKNWIINIHVKDRIKKGDTVPLGKGDTNFEIFFYTLKEINYDGDLIIQGAREDLNGKMALPEETCKKYHKFVKQYVDKYF